MSSALIYAAVRTPFGRYGGGLAGMRPDDLAATAIKALLATLPDLDPARVDDVVFCAADGAGEDNRNVGRMSGLLAGLPVTVPLGPSGGRILGTLAAVPGERGERWGVAAICIGVGQGLAVVLENVAENVAS